ncbi:MAG: hypothetical protein II972_02185 [Elusimicrobiaceae bacterium]|nr:hypothetical protein [Elusimicrobiaceae bacterium]
MLKKIIIILIILALTGAVVALVHNLKVAYKNKKELAAFKDNLSYRASLGKVLVIYYSWMGHTQAIANQIAALTKADVYRIETAEVFKSSPAFYTRVKKDLLNKNYPELKGSMPDLSSYDTIFVGGPVWWYTMATPLYSFLGQVDFKGKKVVPFSTQGSNSGSFLEDFKTNAKGANLGSYEKFNNVNKKYDTAVNNKIINWLNNL